MKCELCDLDFEDEKQLNFHHLIPKTYHNNKRILKQYSKDFLNKNGVYLCVSCHNKLHSCLTEKEMAFQFNSIQKLKQIEQIKKWIEWKQKHPNFNNSFNRMTLKKRKELN